MTDAIDLSPLPGAPEPPFPGWQPPVAPPPQRPIPFEDLEAMPGFWERVGAMFRLVFSEPMSLFDQVPVTEGLGAPWRFLLLLSVPVFLIVALMFVLLSMGATLAALEESGHGSGRTMAAILPVIFGVILLLLPLLSFLGMIIGGALNHFFLWLWGGLRPGLGLNQTIRAYGYASAFLQLAALIPYLGFLLQLAGMVVIGIGLARMHRTDTWRGVCAALTPLFLLCCCLGLGLALLIPFMASHHL